MTFKQNLLIAVLSGGLGIIGIIVGFILNERVTKLDMASNCREEFRFLADSKDIENLDEAIFACPEALKSLAERKNAVRRARKETLEKPNSAIPDAMSVFQKIENCESSQCFEIKTQRSELLQRYNAISRRIPTLTNDLSEALQMRDDAAAGRDGTGMAICGPICKSAEQRAADISQDLDVVFDERDQIAFELTLLEIQAQAILSNEL